MLGIRNDSSWKMYWDNGPYVAVDPTDWRTVYSEGTQGTFRVVDRALHHFAARSKGAVLRHEPPAEDDDGTDGTRPVRIYRAGRRRISRCM